MNKEMMQFLRYNLCIAFVAGFMLTIQAQNIQWGEAQALRSMLNTDEVLSVVDNKAYVLHQHKDKNYVFHHFIGCFYEDGTYQKGEFLDDKHYEGHFTFQNQAYLIYSEQDKKHAKKAIKVAAFKQEALDFSQKTISLFELDCKNKQQDKGGYQVCASADASKILIYGMMPYLKKAKAQVGLYVGNANFKQLAAGAANLPQEASRVALKDVVDAVVDNQGTAHLLCKLYKSKEKKEEKKKGSRFWYSLVTMDAGGKIQVLDTLNVFAPEDSALVVSAKLVVNNKQQISCLGTYKQPRHRAGLFQLDFENGTWSTATKINYPAAFIESAYVSPKHLQQKKKQPIEQYKIKQIIQQENGDQLILAEQHYVSVYLDKSEGRQELHRVHNVYVAKLVGKELAWVQMLPKRQKAGGTGFTHWPQQYYSFYAFQKGETLHVLYNDAAKNIGIDEELKLEKVDLNTPQNVVLMHCQLDLSAGEWLEKKPLISYEKERAVITLQQIQLLKGDKLLLLGREIAKKAKEQTYFKLGWLNWNGQF